MKYGESFPAQELHARHLDDEGARDGRDQDGTMIAKI